MTQSLNFFFAAGEVQALTYSSRKDLNPSLVATEPLVHGSLCAYLLQLNLIFRDAAKIINQILHL